MSVRFTLNLFSDSQHVHVFASVSICQSRRIESTIVLYLFPSRNNRQPDSCHPINLTHWITALLLPGYFRNCSTILSTKVTDECVPAPIQQITKEQETQDKRVITVGDQHHSHTNWWWLFYIPAVSGLYLFLSTTKHLSHTRIQRLTTSIQESSW